MASNPIKPPVMAPTWLTDLQVNAPDIIAQLDNIKHDTHNDYRDSHEERKKPFRSDDPFKKPRP